MSKVCTKSLPLAIKPRRGGRGSYIDQNCIISIITIIITIAIIIIIIIVIINLIIIIIITVTLMLFRRVLFFFVTAIVITMATSYIMSSMISVIIDANLGFWVHGCHQHTIIPQA